MRRKIIVLTGLLIIGSLALGGLALAADGFVLQRSVIGSAGEPVSNSTYTLNSTLGESIVGQWQPGPVYGSSTGFWCPNITGSSTIYLPIVVRNPTANRSQQ